MRTLSFSLVLALTSAPSAVLAAYSGVARVGPGRAYATPTQALADTATWCRPAIDSTTPCLVTVDPGTYDLGSDRLIMKPFIDIEGAGDGTILLSSAASAVIFGDTFAGVARAELRQVKLIASNQPDHSSAVLVTSKAEAKLSHVTVSVSGDAYAQTGVSVGGKAELNDVALSVAGAKVQVGVAVGTGTGSGTVLVNDSTITVASTGGYEVKGIHAYGGDFRVIDSTVSAFGTWANTVGVWLTGGKVLLEGSHVYSEKRAILNDDLNGVLFGSLRALDSEVVAPIGIISDAGSTALFGASTLDGSAIGSPVCIDTVDGSGIPLSETCQVP